ncbi:ER membrane protein complex subunit 8/9 homolog [Aristolochia californica]|uniref:ER membrane protein complex subunit 8/9 homolog n=1 Tax=Aristolochia californica TaxID=171875 RepID=UPI0035DDDBE3
MGSECKYEILQSAYIKLVLHALKHKASSVNSILVGRLLNGNLIEISDAIPLSHTQIPLLPTLEIALLQVEEYFKSEGLSVVGYCHANERYDDSELGNVPKKIGDQIFRYFPQAAILLLDNKKLEALQKGNDRSPVVQLYTRDASKSWRQTEPDSSSQLTLKEPSANVVLLDYISTEKWQEIVDFDDHLDDISKDWLNADLFK